MSDRKREAVKAKIQRLMQMAATRPGPNDPLGMVGFGSILLAAQMHVLLQREATEPKEQ